MVMTSDNRLQFIHGNSLQFIPSNCSGGSHQYIHGEQFR